MKNKSLYIAALAAGALAMNSCSDNWENPPMSVPTFPEGLEANMTIADFKTQYWQDAESYGTEVGRTAEGDSIILIGTVVSSTEAGNIYKALVVEDETGAITIGLDDSDVSAAYPMGAAVSVNVTGMTVGRYSGLMQLGTTSGSGVDRISLAAFQPRTHVDILEGKLDTTLVTIPDLLEASRTTEGKIKWQSRLIRINDVKFVEAGQEFAPGSTTSRYITDAEGNRMIVYNSSYSDFAYEKLPYGTGDVVGILSCYRTSWQLLLIDINSCIDFDGEGAPEPGTEVTPAGEGTAESPYNVAKAIEIIRSGDAADSEVFVKGTIDEISEIDLSYGNATYNINDGKGTVSLTVYCGYSFNGDKFTSQTEIEAGKEITIYGKLMSYNGSPQVAQGSRIISYDGTTGDIPATPSGLVLLSKSDANGLNGWTITNDAVWIWKTLKGAYYLNGQLFGVDPVPTEDAYAISPEITVGDDASFSFEHAAKFQDSGLRTDCGIVIREAGASEWTALEMPNWPEADTWTFVSSGSISLKDYAGKNVQIGFKYGCKATDTWEIQNLTLVNAALK